MPESPEEAATRILAATDPEDDLSQIRADFLSAHPEAVLETLDMKAEDFLRECVIFAKQMSLAENPYTATRILIDAIIWMKEANEQLAKEISAQRPKTPERGRRGGVA